MSGRNLTGRRKVARQAREDLSLYLDCLAPRVFDDEEQAEQAALKYLLQLRTHVEQLVDLNAEVTGSPLIEL